MIKLLSKYFFTCVLLVSGLMAKAQQSDDICGKWMSSGRDLLVQVYRGNGDYKAKIIWFKADDNSKPMDEWTDKHNPNAALRKRKLLGMNVLEGLRFNAKSKTWDDGYIYEAKSGRTWNASASLSASNTLKVTGYWHLKFIGRTMTFNRADDYQALSTH